MIEMVKVTGGLFESAGIQKQISNFSIGKYPVTQGQWKEIMGSNPSYFKGCDECPVESVNWDDIQEFLKKLNALTGKTYRLPTEAEWEYAARGGIEGKKDNYLYAGSNDLDEVGWYNENSGSTTKPVGLKNPNQLGLHDMSGNVWEWCQDWYSDYPAAALSDRLGSRGGSYRVIRGGSWCVFAVFCRVSYRNLSAPAGRFSYVGFRLAHT